MRGGMFSGSGSPPVAVTDSENLPTIIAGTDDISRGGLFAETGTNIVAGKTGEEWAADARRYAEYSGKWAVGPSDFDEDTLTGFSDANNSKYYAGQSEASASAAAGSATAASNSATQAAISAAALCALGCEEAPRLLSSRSIFSGSRT